MITPTEILKSISDIRHHLDSMESVQESLETLRNQYRDLEEVDQSKHNSHRRQSIKQIDSLLYRLAHLTHPDTTHLSQDSRTYRDLSDIFSALQATQNYLINNTKPLDFNQSCSSQLEDEAPESQDMAFIQDFPCAHEYDELDFSPPFDWKDIIYVAIHKAFGYSEDALLKEHAIRRFVNLPLIPQVMDSNDPVNLVGIRIHNITPGTVTERGTNSDTTATTHKFTIELDIDTCNTTQPPKEN